MRRCASLTAIAMFLCFLSLSAMGQQHFLYEPKPVGAEETNQTKDGVLVTEVTVQKGDTLYSISRKLNGRGMYYSQILLFNKIKDPGRIYPGDILRIPVFKNKFKAESAKFKESSVIQKKPKAKDEAVVKPKTAAPATINQTATNSRRTVPVTEISLSDLKALEEKKQVWRTNKKNTEIRESKKVRSENIAMPDKLETVSKPSVSATAGQNIFDMAVKAYNQNDYRTAIELFDQYLSHNSNSPMAADASLYKAECYLKLSSR